MSALSAHFLRSGFLLAAGMPICRKAESKLGGMKPREPTSKVKWNTVQPRLQHSSTRPAYRRAFLVAAFSMFSSQGTVSSRRTTVFAREDHTTPSGHSGLAAISAGKRERSFE